MGSYSREMSYDDIRFWFSENANTGRHCMLLQFHLSFQIRYTTSFKEIADTSFKHGKKALEFVKVVLKIHNIFICTALAHWYFLPHFAYTPKD